MSIEEHLKALEKLDDEGKKDYLLKLNDNTKLAIMKKLNTDEERIKVFQLLQNDYFRNQAIALLFADEYKLQGAKLIAAYYRFRIIESLTSDSSKLEGIKLLKDDPSKTAIIKSLTSDSSKLEGIKLLESDTDKNAIIKLLTSDSSKLEGINILSSDHEKYQMISRLSHDEELDAGKLKVISHMTDDFWRGQTVQTLSSDSYKLKGIKLLSPDYYNMKEIIKSLSSDSAKLEVITLLKDESHRIEIIKLLTSNSSKLEGIKLLESDYSKANIIKTFKTDKDKLEGLSLLTVESCKAEVIESLSSDSSKLEGIKLLESDYSKAAIIETFKTDKDKLEGIKLLSPYSYYIENIIELLSSDSAKLEGIKLLESDYSKAKIIKTFKTDKDKLEGLSLLTVESCKAEVIESLSSDSSKLEGIKLLESDYSKANIIKTFKTDKNKLEGLSLLTDDLKKYKIVESFQTKELKLEALSVFDDESYIDKILKQYSSDEAKLNAIEAIEDITSKIIIIGRLSSEDLKNKTLESLDNYEAAMKSLIAKGKLNYLLFEKDILEKVFNDLELKIIEKYKSIDQSIKKQYQEYIANNFNSITSEMIDLLPQILYRLCYSNSAKLAHLYEELATSILQSNDPLKKLEEIEHIYLSNHLPDVAKTYAVFRVFHTQKDGNLKINNNVASPFLKREHNQDFREMAVFSDLIKASIDSNSKSIRDYIKVVVDGDKLYKDILSGKEINVNDEEIQQKLNYYSRVLIALYNNSLKGKEKPYQSTGDVLTDIGVCIKRLSPNGNMDYDIPNRITRMFLHFAGFDTIEELSRYMDEKVHKTTEKNQEFSKDGTKLHKSQLIKGLKSVDYLHFNLQNGCVSSDFLGSQALKSGDATPLDIDVALVIDDEIDIADGIKKSCASGYGPPWIIVDTDEDFYDSTDNPKYQKGKYELFSAKQSQNDWYGVRTGFGSTNIRCIIVNNYTEKIGFEIALAGFYIPVKDRQGKLLFSYEDYEKLVAKMAGLKHYDKPEFIFSPNLVTPEIADLKRQKVADKERVTTLGNAVKKEIYEAISSFEFLPGKNLTPEGVMDGDLTAGFVEVIDTGSTGRETNAPGDGDFDFMLRIDNDILKDSDKMNKLRSKLCKTFGVDSSVIDGKGEIRIKGVEIIPGHKVDVDISFKPKTDEINYSTDMCLKDRLSSIKEQDPEKYEYVVANICYAKKVLQEAGCYYKHGHSKWTGKGGLGGVGVENWILQHGGSFVDAARSFLEASYNEDKTGFVSWEEFKSRYKVWDFGENFREGRYDEFVHDNMDKAGYEAMYKYLMHKYLEEYIHKQNSNNLPKSDLETMFVENTELNTIPTTNQTEK